MSVSPYVGNAQAEPVAYLNSRLPVLDMLLLNGSSVTATSTTPVFFYGNANHASLFVSVGSNSGSGSITFKLNIVETASGQIFASYPAAVISTNGNAVAFVSNNTSSIGTAASVTWTVTGSPTYNSVYARLIAKV